MGGWRSAIALLPLALLPQVLLSRVACGDAMGAWTAPAALGGLWELARFLGSADATVLKGLIAVLSLPLVSRPAAAALDMPTDSVGAGMLLVEWMYLALLLAGYLGALWLLFSRLERRWQKLR